MALGKLPNRVKKEEAQVKDEGIKAATKDEENKSANPEEPGASVASSEDALIDFKDESSEPISASNRILSLLYQFLERLILTYC